MNLDMKRWFKIRYLIGVFCVLICILVFNYGQSFKESVFTEGFPIPGKAEVYKMSEEHNFESYKWNGASEENGLPLRYKVVIRLAGWKNVDTFGTMTTFEKDGVKIEVMSSTKMIDLYSEK